MSLTVENAGRHAAGIQTENVAAELARVIDYRKSVERGGGGGNLSPAERAAEIAAVRTYEAALLRRLE